MNKNFYFLITLVFISVFSSRSGAQMISTLAGNGTAAFGPDGVAATASQLNTPYGVAVDGSGNVYVADQLNNRIRKINASGIISTIAGTGVIGYWGDGGMATAAQIYAPRGIAVDASGNVYFSDYGNTVIRKISTSGIITTIAGNGFVGSGGDGTPATSAQLYYPWGVAVDPAGNVYIADQMNNKVRKVNTSGIISTIAGTGVTGFSGDGGPAIAAKLNTPTGVAVDASGTVYIADYANNKVRKINSSGTISTIAGVGLPAFGYAGDGGPATAAHLYYPMGIAVDLPGNVYICDRNNSCIRKIDPGVGGIINTIAGNDTAGFSGDGGPAIHAELNMMTGVAVRDNGDIYISDNDNNRVRHIKIGDAPFFINGHIQNVVRCPSEFFSIDTLMRVGDFNIGQTETWSVVQPAVHGTVFAVYSTTSTGSTMTPSGLNYSPVSGYYGPDSFKIEVNDGTLHDTTTVYITIVPAPSAGEITGIDSVCPGNTRVLTDTAGGGVWSSSNPAFATVSSSGVVTGVAPGTVTITYTVTNVCGTATAIFPLSVIATSPCISGASSLTEPVWGNINLSPNPNHGSFNVSILSPIEEEVKVVVTNVLGNKIMDITLPANKTNEIKFDQPSGVYFISANTEHLRSNARFTIVK